MKILIIGGHITPALVLMDFAYKNEDDLVFVGTKTNSESRADLLRERELVQNYSASYEELPQIKLHRHKRLKSVAKLPTILNAAWKARKIIHRHQPDVVVGFGGYLSIVVGLAAKMSSTPIVVHEQTTQAGLANQLVAKVSGAVAISYESSRQYFPPDKTVLTGNLVRSEYFGKSKKPIGLEKLKGKFIFVTGGSQGSERINRALMPLLAEITKDFSLVHQYGNTGQEDLSDDEFGKLYIAKPWFEVNEIVWLMQNAEVVVCRAGANTVAELMTVGTPAVLIPLKYANKDEQYYNAKLISDVGAGEIVIQDNLDSDTLRDTINQILKNDTYKLSASKMEKRHKKNAVNRLYQMISEVVN